MTIAELLFFEDILTPEYAERLKTIGKPSMLCGRVVPDSLDGLTYGQLIDLQKASNARELIVVSARAILGEDLQEQKIMAEDGEAFYGFILWLKSEVERINDLFKSVEYQPTPEEVQAGYYKMNLNLGEFPTLDWYARRMGIADHDEVLKVGWVRIFACKKIDHENQLFQKRVQDLRDAKARQKKR